MQESLDVFPIPFAINYLLWSFIHEKEKGKENESVLF